MAGKRETVEAGHGLELLRRHGAVRFGRQEVAGAGHGAMGDGGAAGARPVIAARGQPARQALDHGVDGKRLQRLGEVGEGFAQQAGQDGIVGHDLGHEGRLAADRGRHRGRVDIEHAVGEAGIDGGVAVMRLVGMQHHDLAAAAGPQRAAIVEGLGAPQGQADAVGLVAMGVVGMAAEARRQALHARARLVEADLVAVQLHKRSRRPPGACRYGVA